MTTPTASRRALLLGSALVLTGCGAKAVAPATSAPGPTPARGGSGTPAASASPSASTGGVAARWLTPGDDISSGPTSTSRVALTFHGQGDPSIAHAVLALLARRGAQVTVMCVGTWVAQYPSLVREIAAAGHDLGNHTWSHPSGLTSMSQAAVREEIRRCSEAVRQATGAAPKWFRPSATQHSTPTIRAAARAEGFPRCTSFDVDPRDFLEPGAATVAARTRAGVRSGSIVSLHLGHQATVEALPHILDDLAARSLQPVTLSRLLDA